MKKFVSKLNQLLFISIGGKITLSIFAIFGIMMLITSIPQYSLAFKLVANAREKQSMAEEGWQGHPLSRCVIFKDYRNVRGKGYVENLYEGRKTIEGVEWVKPTCSIINEPDSMAVFSRFENGRGSRKGYMNVYNGEVVLPDIYKHAWNFKNGKYAVVCLDNDSLYIIDRKGKQISKCGFRQSNRLRLGFVFNDNLCVMESNDGKFGIINPRGEWVLPPNYEWIERNPRTGTYRIRENGLEGVIGSDLTPVLPVEFKEIAFHEPDNDYRRYNPWYWRVGFWTKNVDGTRSYYDEMGKLITKSPYLSIIRLKYECDTDRNLYISEKATEYFAYRIDDKWGLMNKQGIRLTEPIYTSLYAVDEDIFCAGVERDVTILIDSKGQEISQ